jgi:two-component system OmpR family response regulator
MRKPDRILIVDDDPEIRRLLADYLERNSFTPVTARDGREMRQALDRHAIDLIVLDLTLPGCDGLTLCRDLRSQSNLPVLMLTARSEEADRILGIEMGADDYLVKPFSPRELLGAHQDHPAPHARAAAQPAARSRQRCLVFAGWCLDTAARGC